MKAYIKPEIKIIELETTVSILSASGSISDDGSGINTTGNFGEEDAGNIGAAKRHSIWSNME